MPRHALISESLHCQLPAPLFALVLGYEQSTTDELWATSIGSYLLDDDALRQLTRDSSVHWSKRSRNDGVGMEMGKVQGLSALLFAAANGRLEAMKSLLLRGASIDERDLLGNTALLLSVVYGDMRNVEWLLKSGGAKITERTEKHTSLMMAAEKENFGMFKFLLSSECGANIFEINKNGESALSIAIARGHYAMVKLLVDKGASSKASVLELAGEDGVGPPLVYPAKHGRLQLLQYLLEHGGSSIKERCIDGNNALLHAAFAGQLPIIQWLLSQGLSSITETNNIGQSALLLAAHKPRKQNSLLVVTWLLEYGGSSVTETDINGHTIWDVLKSKFADSDIPYTSDDDSDDSDDDGDNADDDNDDNAGDSYSSDDDDFDDDAVVAALFSVMVLQHAPPATLVKKLKPCFSALVDDGARLRAGRPAYLARRLALLGEYCPLDTQLRALVHAYEEPTSAELWATGL
jgi:ankyrin repeat protein